MSDKFHSLLRDLLRISPREFPDFSHVLCVRKCEGIVCLSCRNHLSELPRRKEESGVVECLHRSQI